MPKRALLIVNRKSRSGASDPDVAIDFLKRHGIEILEQELHRPQQISELIRANQHQVDCVIIGGGDGSMNAAAAALIDTQLPLGVLPLGTANDLARTLHIPTDIEQACEVITSGVPHAIDLGRVNGHYFFNVANIGLGVHVAHHLSPDMKQRWGVFSYARSLLKAFRSFRPFHADIVCDGRHRRVRSMQIAVGNGRHYGGGMTVAEQASIDDHRFSLYSVEPIHLWEMVRLAPAFRTGRFEGHDPVDIDHGRHIVITTRKPMTISADGEILTHTPAQFEMIAGAVKVFVPENYFDQQQELRHAAQR
ncbi:MAG TPA: lipid kinase [Noviherbaspirillum sp.]|nr:lipid kinase [Noviherbaspirillum sp.]